MPGLAALNWLESSTMHTHVRTMLKQLVNRVPFQTRYSRSSSSSSSSSGLDRMRTIDRSIAGCIEPTCS